MWKEVLQWKDTFHGAHIVLIREEEGERSANAS